MEEPRAAEDLVDRDDPDPRYFSIDLSWPGLRRMTIKINKIVPWLLADLLLWAGIILLIYRFIA